MHNVVKLNKQLASIRSIHRDQAEGHFSVAQVLYDIQQSNAYEALDYETWQEFMHGIELPYSPSAINNYATLIAQQKRLNYTKTEMLDFLRHQSVNAIVRELRQIDKKITLRTLTQRCRTFYKQHPQINFTLAPDQMAALEKLLETHGLAYSDDGRRIGMGESLLSAVGIQAA